MIQILAPYDKLGVSFKKNFIEAFLQNSNRGHRAFKKFHTAML